MYLNCRVPTQIVQIPVATSASFFFILTLGQKSVNNSSVARHPVENAYCPMEKETNTSLGHTQGMVV